MIIETIISTVNSKGQVNFAPFGIKKIITLFIYPPTSLQELLKILT